MLVFANILLDVQVGYLVSCWRLCTGLLASLVLGFSGTLSTLLLPVVLLQMF